MQGVGACSGARPGRLVAGVALPLAAPLCVFSAALSCSAHETPSALRSPVLRIRNCIVDRFIAPRRGLLLTRVGYGDPLEDASLYGGFYLAALAHAFRVTHGIEEAALCRQVLAGLLLNASVGEPGFLARGVEQDLAHWRGDPSVDQYTGVFYGLALFVAEGPALPWEKERIAGVVRAMLKRFERRGWQIFRADGKRVTTFGRLAAVRPTRAERLLALLSAGAELTGDEYWKERALELWPARAGALHGYGKFDSWVLIQTAAALDLLRRCDRDPAHRRVIDAACRETAAACLSQIAPWNEFRRDPRPAEAKLADRAFALRTVRIPVEAVATVMIVGADDQARQAAKSLIDMIEHLPVDEADYSPPLVSLELAWWTAVARGVVDLQQAAGAARR